jgi:predicted AlkP superfamily pyrophosphatase or phosphodiesterase
MRRRSPWQAGFALATSFLLVAAAADARSLLVISIDGMRPDSILDARTHGLNVPNLQRFVSEGSYARGVRGVAPTITYPSHTTLVTGVTPAEHGILSNDPFDPLLEEPGASYYYAADVKADTLWDASARAGLSTAAVAWPETVGAKTIQYNLPHLEPYRSENTVKMQRALSRPEGLLADLESTLATSYFQEGSAAGSQIRTRFSIEMMRRYKPQFMLVHLVAVDYASHRHGPFSAESKRALEAEDAMIGELAAAMRANDPDTVVAVVSDHGPVPVTRALNVRVAFIEAGLLKIDAPQPGQAVRVVDWQADIWSAGGSAAVVLKNPADTAVRAKVAALLQRLAADPANGINAIIEGAEASKLGGWPNASFVIDMKPGTAVGSAYLGDTLVTYPSTRGTHGYLPAHSGVNASFFIMGTGVRKKHDLGVIDMRQIAPTLAQALGVTLKDAKQPVLPVFADSPKRN